MKRTSFTSSRTKEPVKKSLTPRNSSTSVEEMSTIPAQKHPKMTGSQLHSSNARSTRLSAALLRSRPHTSLIMIRSPSLRTKWRTQSLLRRKAEKQLSLLKSRRSNLLPWISVAVATSHRIMTLISMARLERCLTTRIQRMG